MEDALAQLSRLLDWIQALAPEVWAMYLRQQYIKGALNVGTAILCALTIAVLIKVGLWALQWKVAVGREDRGLYEFAIFMCVTIGVICAIVAPFALYSGLERLLSPGYAAIQDLLSVVK